MTDTVEEVRTKLIKDINVSGDANEVAIRVKSLKTFAEAEALYKTEPIPEPEPTGFKAWLNRHSGDLIKVGGTLVVVLTIAIFESKGDIIFRSKSSKLI